MFRPLLLFAWLWAAAAGAAAADDAVARLGPAAAGGPPPGAVFLGGKPMTVRAPPAPPAPGPGANPWAAGYSGLPFTVSRTNKRPDLPYLETRYPYRAIGRLAFRYAGANTWCTAALIDKGLAVTTASCVAEFGRGFHPDGRWAFTPGFYKGVGAYGTFAYQDVFVPKPFLDGTDSCAGAGIQCANDVAVVVLKPNRRKQYPGMLTGWLDWATDATYFFQQPDVAPAVPFTQASQLGYSGDIYDGAEMLRSDAPVFLPDLPGGNGLFGSLMYGIGQPLIADFDGIDFAQDPSLPVALNINAPNMVFGVTTFIVIEDFVQLVRPHMAGATLFTQDNIGALVADACKAYPDACSASR